MRKILDLKAIKIWIERKLNIQNYLKNYRLNINVLLLVWLYLMMLGYGIEKYQKLFRDLHQNRY